MTARHVISGPIDEVAAANLRSFLAHNAGEPVDVELNSTGGSPFSGIEMFHALQDHGNASLAITGLAASAASLVAMGARHVSMKAGTLLMIHNSSAMTLGTADLHRHTASALDKIDSQMISIYSARSKQPRSKIAKFLSEEKWFTGPEAVAASLVDHAEPQAQEKMAARVATGIGDIPENFNQQRFAAALARAGATRRNPMPELENENVDTVDVTAEILTRAESAGLDLKATNKIIVAAAGSLDKAKDLLIEAVHARSVTAATIPSNVGGDPAGFEAAIGNAIKAKLDGKPLQPGTPFAQMSFPQLAAEFLRANSIRPAGNDAASLVRQAMGARNISASWLASSPGLHSTSDFVTILGLKIGDKLQELFKAADSGIGNVASTGTVPDFRPQTTGKLSSFPAMKLLGEGAQIEFGTLQEGGEQVRAVSYARGIAVTLETLTNDNTGAILRSLNDVAFGAVNVKAQLLIDALLSAPMSDGKVLFDEDHANILSGVGVGVVPSVAALGAVRKKLRLQTAIDGETVLGLGNSLKLLVPAKWETEANAIAASITPARAEDANEFSGRVQVYCEPRLDGIAPDSWFAFDGSLPAIQFVTLESTPSPRLEVSDSFDRLGSSFRVWWAIGSAPVEHRSAIKVEVDTETEE